MAGFADYEQYDALGLADLVRRGKVAPTDLLEAAIERVEARNPTVNAVIMRLYDHGRRAIADYPIGDYIVPARSMIFMSPYVTQRDARFFRCPERFDPGRWTAAFKAELPRFAYFPFGGGVRQCIGESFAWMELVLVVATVAQQWRLLLAPHQAVVPQPLITLRAKHGIMMIPTTR